MFEDVGEVNGQPVLVARILGPTPASIDAMSDSQLQTAALYALAEALAAASGKEEEAGVPRSPVSSACLRWSSSNPWCPGGATSPGAQPLVTDLQAAAAPVKQTLMFAGRGVSGPVVMCVYLCCRQLCMRSMLHVYARQTNSLRIDSFGEPHAQPPCPFMCACWSGEHTAPARLLGTFAGALLSGCREAARAVKLLQSSGPTSLEVSSTCVFISYTAWAEPDAACSSSGGVSGFLLHAPSRQGTFLLHVAVATAVVLWQMLCARTACLLHLLLATRL